MDLLAKAIEDGNFDETLRLLKTGIDPNVEYTDRHFDKYSNALSYAVKTVQANDTKFIDLLLQFGAKPDYWTLYWALTKFNVEVIKKLIDRGANPDDYNRFAESPLHAISNSHQKDRGKTCELLLRQGLDVNHLNPCDETPLLVALLCSNKDIVELLLKYGAKPCLSYCGLTPLKYTMETKLLKRVTMIKCAVLQVTSERETQFFFEELANQKSKYLTLAGSCIEEVRKLKNIQLGESGKSLFDFASSQIIAVDLQNNDGILKTVFDNIPNFNAYRDILLSRLDKERIVCQLVKHSCIVDWKFDLFIVENIFSFLTEADAYNFYIALTCNSKQ